MRRRLRLRAAATALAAVLGAVPGAGARSAIEATAPRAERVEESAPTSVPAGLRERLAPRAWRVTDDGGLLAVIRPARDLAGASPSGARRASPLHGTILFPGISPGAFAGVLEIHRPWTDYRGRAAGPGVWSLRYAMQPPMKEHLGTTPYLDFLLLVPAAQDRDASPAASGGRAGEPEGDAALGAAGAGGGHPAVMAIDRPAADAVEGAVVESDRGIALVVTIGSERIALVLAGSVPGDAL